MLRVLSSIETDDGECWFCFCFQVLKRKWCWLQLLEEAMALGLLYQDIPAFQLSTVPQWGQKMWLRTYGPLLMYHQVSIIIPNTLLTGCFSSKANDLCSECTWFEFLWGHQLFRRWCSWLFLLANARIIIWKSW